MSMDSNQAAVVLVTGGARRLGAEIVRQMHAAGARVVVHFRSSVVRRVLADGLRLRRD